MNTNEKSKSLLLAIVSKVLMIAGGFLLWRIIDNGFPPASFGAFFAVCLSVFIYVLGASLIGRSIRLKNVIHPHHEIRDGIMFAFLLIGVGVLLIFLNVGSAYWKSFFISWQMALFVAGSICLCRSKIISGILLSATGMFFLIGKFGDYHYISQLWPVFFIIAGIAIVLSFFIRQTKCCKRHPKGNWIDDYMPGEQENNDGKINYRFVFSGTEQVILNPVFKGGSIEAVFGGMELDLRRTSLPDGKTYLYITTVFGGVDIKAPDHWDIELVSKSFAGGVTDSRIKVVDKDASRTLIIIAKCTFGGITLQ